MAQKNIGGESVIENEAEIQNLLKMVFEARTKTQEIEQGVEQARETNKAIKQANDERFRKIQEENRELDSQLGSKEITLNKAKSEIENRVFEARAKLLRRIIFCNLKNLLKETQVTSVEKALSTIYTGRFAIVYDDIAIGDKPVNKYEWIVRIKLTETPGQMVRDLLPHVWSTFNEIHWGWHDEPPQFYQRDFKSEEEAKGYAERNRAKICQKLIEGIRQVEWEIEAANDNIDNVFDFRFITSGSIETGRSQSERFQIASAEKHQLILRPILSSYDREVEKIKPYTITVTQQGYQLTIAGHRFAAQAREIKYAICRYFNTEFKAIEADTQQEIQNPS
jgi:hypothetical protein